MELSISTPIFQVEDSREFNLREVPNLDPLSII